MADFPTTVFMCELDFKGDGREMLMTVPYQWPLTIDCVGSPDGRMTVTSTGKLENRVMQVHRGGVCVTVNTPAAGDGGPPLLQIEMSTEETRKVFQGVERVRGLEIVFHMDEGDLQPQMDATLLKYDSPGERCFSACGNRITVKLMDLTERSIPPPPPPPQPAAPVLRHRPGESSGPSY